MKYLHAFGWFWVMFTIVAYIGQNAMAIGQNVWLSRWTTEAKQVKDTAEWVDQRNNRLGIYGLLGFLQGEGIVLFFVYMCNLFLAVNFKFCHLKKYIY